MLHAQKTDLYEGSMDALKGQSKVNAVYDYSKMSVGDFDKEADYLDEKSADRNKDEAGSGDSWRMKWAADREARFEPKFEELFNEYMSGHKLKAGHYPDAKYTIIVKTTHTEPGWNVGVMRRSAHINAEIWLVATANMDKALGKFKLTKVPGRDAWGFDFDTGARLEESYAMTGKVFAKYRDKKVF
jgi:hypothetical protein